MSDNLIVHCKTVLSNLIASVHVQQSHNPYKDFTEGIMNFISHYCLDDHTSSLCHHAKVKKKHFIRTGLFGPQYSLHTLMHSRLTHYSTEHLFTCRSQVAAFTSLLEEMSTHPQDYVSDHGRLTTNAVEGFHGLALVYRGKRTDQWHKHYVCKTNMAMCHKVSTQHKKCIESIGT